MYTIYADGKLLYSPDLFQEGYGVFSPKLTVELNKAGSLDFTMPPNNVMFDGVKKLKTIITAFQNGEEMFRGRVLHDDKDFYNQKKTYCEGELAFLLDSRQRPYTHIGTAKELFTKFINNHNTRVEAAKQFKVGNVTVTGANSTLAADNEGYSNTFDEMSEKLIDPLGGYLKIRVVGKDRYLDWLQESGKQVSQTIEFGINLLDITEYITAEDIYTVLIPVGKTLTDDEGNSKGKLTIASVNDGKDYLENATAIALFGRIEEDVEWSEVEEANVLKSLGTELLNANIEMAVTLSLKAVDMHILDISHEQIHVGDWVRVISIPHGLNKLFQCTKIVYDMSSPDQTEYVFGLEYTSLTSQQVQESKNIQSTMGNAASIISAASRSANAAAQAVKDVEEIIADIPSAENVLPTIYPVGAIYISTISTNPASLFGFGKWEQIAQGRTLFGAGTLNDIVYSGGDLVEPGLPNVIGEFRAYSEYNKNNTDFLNVLKGPFWYNTNESDNYATSTNMSSGSNDTIRQIHFDLSKANAIYGNSETVQPAALVVYIWKRTE